METKIALIEQATTGIKERIEHGEERTEKLEVLTNGFKTERANIIAVVKWTFLVCGGIGSCIALFILIANFLSKH